MFFMSLLMALMALLIVKDASRSWRIHTAKPAAMAQSSEGDKTSQTNETQNARD
jgi:hypothetical protein